MPIIWMGTQLAYETLARREKKYEFEKEAWFPYPDDDQSDNQVDEVFGVKASRIGLTVMEKVGDTAVIKVHGSLTAKYSRWHSWFPGEVTSYEAIRDALQIAAEDEGSKSVLMDIASGGGMVSGLDMVTQVMRRVNAVKPVNGHTDRSAFSAAYWIMAGCRNVSASRMAEVGSIGTLAIVANMADPSNHYEMQYTVFREGEFKALGNPYEKLTEDAKAYIQKNIKEANQFFLEHVSQSRNLMVSESQVWAEGKTFYAREAVQNGLIDRIANLDDLIGSGAAATTTGDNRSYEMNISAEKRAQIAAGADPKVVLTAEELKAYNAEVKAAEEAAEEEEEKGKEDDKEDGEGEEGEGEGKEGEGEEEGDGKTAQASATLVEELKSSMRENGKLEAKLEAMAEKLAKAEARVTELQAESAELMKVAKTAVANLQVATQSPKEEKATAAEVIAQFAGLQAKLAKTFKIGQHSAQAQVDDAAPVQNVTGYRDVTKKPRA